MVIKFPPFPSERKKRTISVGSLWFPNAFFEKWLFHLTSKRNFRILWIGCLLCFFFLLTTIIFSCNPSKFCISRRHTVNFPTSTFSAQTVAASWLRSVYVCSLDTKTYGGRENFPWKRKKTWKKITNEHATQLISNIFLGGWEQLFPQDLHAFNALL